MFTKYIQWSFLILICSIATISCKKIPLEDYNGDTYLQFVKRSTDTILVPLFLYPNQDFFNIKLPIQMIGYKKEERLTFNFNIDQNSTAPTSMYRIEDHLGYNGAQAKDTIHISVYRHQDVIDKDFILKINLLDNENFKLGETKNISQVIRITDKVTRPGWWDSQMENNFLGKYSDTKYKKFIEIVGEGNIGDYAVEKQRELMLEFKYYLIKMRDKGTPILEDDGRDMLSTIPLIG